MGNINLTKILISSLVVTFTIATIFGTYLSFCNINGCTIQEPYNSAFQNISAQYNQFSGVAKDAGNEGLAKNILNFGSNLVTGTVNVFVVGLEAMAKFFGMIPIIGNIFNVLLGIFPEPVRGLIYLFGFVIIPLYIAMRYIQSVSNKFDLP